MKTTKHILLFVGIVSILVSFFSLYKGDPFKEHIISLVCGLSLLYGYFEINKMAK